MRRPIAGLALAGLGAAYLAIIRPWMLAWGATAAERQGTLPGDDLLSAASYVTTRSITIDAPPDRIWPWLVQMGQDRAGFYTHNWVEQILRSGIQDAHHIDPAWQTLRAGDLMHTNHDIGGKPIGWPVAAVDPPRSIVMRSTKMPAGTYAFVLEAIDECHTRLVVRDRAKWKASEWPFTLFIYEPLHAYMETGVLQGIKVRVETAEARGSVLAAT